jgi:hypothetical protein
LAHQLALVVVVSVVVVSVVVVSVVVVSVAVSVVSVVVVSVAVSVVSDTALGKECSGRGRCSRGRHRRNIRAIRHSFEDDLQGTIHNRAFAAVPLYLKASRSMLLLLSLPVQTEPTAERGSERSNASTTSLTAEYGN